MESALKTYGSEKGKERLSFGQKWRTDKGEGEGIEPHGHRYNPRQD